MEVRRSNRNIFWSQMSSVNTHQFNGKLYLSSGKCSASIIWMNSCHMHFIGHATLWCNLNSLTPSYDFLMHELYCIRNRLIYSIELFFLCLESFLPRIKTCHKNIIIRILLYRESKRKEERKLCKCKFTNKNISVYWNADIISLFRKCSHIFCINLFSIKSLLKYSSTCFYVIGRY